MAKGVVKFVNATNDILYGTILFHGGGRANFTLQSKGSEYETQVEGTATFCWSPATTCNGCDGSLTCSPGVTYAIGAVGSGGCV